MSDQHGVHPDCLQHWSDGLAEYQGIDRRLLTDPLPQLQVVLLTAADWSLRGRVLGPEVRSKVAGEHPVEPVQNKKLGIFPSSSGFFQLGKLRLRWLSLNK